VRERKAIERVVLEEELAAIANAYIKPALLRHYIQSIEGVELDGQPITAEILVTGGGLTQFADEIYQFMEANNGLPPFANNNSQSPSPSPTAEDGSSSSTTASTVNA